MDKCFYGREQEARPESKSSQVVLLFQPVQIFRAALRVVPRAPTIAALQQWEWRNTTKMTNVADIRSSVAGVALPGKGELDVICKKNVKIMVWLLGAVVMQHVHLTATNTRDISAVVALPRR